MIEGAILPLAVGAVLFGVIVYRPLLGACLFLVANPLVVGVARGDLGVVLRPNELLIAFILAAVAARGLLLLLGGRWRPAPFDGMDVALLGLVVTGCVMPVLWRALRGLPLSGDDLLYAVVLVKYYALFRLFRSAVQDAAGVATCLRVALVASSVVAVIALLESMRAPGVAAFLEAYFDRPFSGSEGLVEGRAAATIASVFGLADLMVFSVVAALAMRRVSARGRGLLAASVPLFISACIVAGTFSGLIGLAVALLAFGLVIGRAQRTILAGIAGCALAAVAFWPVLEQRLVAFSQTAGMPSSWQGRMANLNDYFLPGLAAEGNWLLGVQPAPRLPAPEAWRDWIYIESGYVWLLWIGGVPFLLAFLGFVAFSLRRLAHVARLRHDAIGAAAVAGFCAVAVVAVLMVLDPHLTIRGGADLFFPLLALALVPAPAMAAASVTMPPPRPARRPAPRRLACG